MGPISPQSRVGPGKNPVAPPALLGPTNTDLCFFRCGKNSVYMHVIGHMHTYSVDGGPEAADPAPIYRPPHASHFLRDDL
ncbi:hypothetical protein XELAEV_18036428mg [Xenopus laevis]|uniref:Uncharacterized protein n=1 Tax=Xenopus laevis TaxID=8355 RepID=A0A974CJN5_XENLA|nr:hypothetical protein XELAEV_18036428mg [Xenopus laevis]